MTLPHRLFDVAARPSPRVSARFLRGALIVVFLVCVWIDPRCSIALVVAAGHAARERLARHREVRRQRSATVRDLPGTLALVRLSIASGRVPREIPLVLTRYDGGALAGCWTAVAEQIGSGAAFRATLDRHLTPEEPHTQRLAVLLAQADAEGGDLGPSLELLSADVTRDRLADLDVRAQRLAVQLLFPLVLCLLPAFILLSVVPLAVSVFDSLGL